MPSTNSQIYLSKLPNSRTTAKKALETAQKTRAALELESKTKLGTIAKHKDQLYQVKSNEAYAALQLEMTHLKEENTRIEEQTIAHMVQEDENRKTITAAQEKIKEEEKLVQAEEAAYQKVLKVVEEEIASRQKERDQAASQADRNLLDRYQRIRQSKGGLAIARVSHESCEGCRMAVRPQVIIEIQKGRDIVTCDTCSRILYVE